jgi:polyisoprenoid-binding protein YceI/mono/diheme cytochrome c family protein
MTVRAWALVVVAALATAPAAARDFSIPPAAGQVRFTIDAPLDSIPGNTRAVGGTASLDPANWAAARARVVVDLTSFRTGIALRDEDLREQFLETSRHPQAVLVVTGFERVSTPKLAPGDPAEGIATGTLALHGVTRPVKIPCQVTLEESGALRITGNFRVTLAEFQIDRPSRLFMKLGPQADVMVRASFEPTAEPRVPAKEAPAAALPKPAPLEDVVTVVAAQLPKKKPAPPSYRFPATSIEGRGERLLNDERIGGPGNTVTCKSCHSTRDERFGMVDDDSIPPANTLFDAAHRATLWQGISPNAGDAASLCAKKYMLRTDDLTARWEGELAAYLDKISPNRTLALDYRPLFATKEHPLERPLAGDRVRGMKLTKLHCSRCHDVNKVRPPLTPGLYEAGYLVSRVRWLVGHDAQQMPAMLVTRLPDNELRDIVTYLADEKQRIFKRKPAK